MPRVPLVAKILVGFVLGTTAGLIMSETCSAETVRRVLPWVSPFGNVLVAMLKAVVCPIILFSLVLGAASLPLRKSGKVGGMVLLWYFATSVFATVLGVAMAYLLDPSMANAQHTASVNMDAVAKMSAAGRAESFGAFVTGLFQNPFTALSNGLFLPIIVFAIGFGLCARGLLDSSGEDSPTAKAINTTILACDGAQKISFRSTCFSFSAG